MGQTDMTTYPTRVIPRAPAARTPRAILATLKTTAAYVAVLLASVLYTAAFVAVGFYIYAFLYALGVHEYWLNVWTYAWVSAGAVGATIAVLRVGDIDVRRSGVTR